MVPALRDQNPNHSTDAMKILIIGSNVEALAANYVLADQGHDPKIITNRLRPQGHNAFVHGPWTHTGASPLLAAMLDDFDLEVESYELSSALYGSDLLDYDHPATGPEVDPLTVDRVHFGAGALVSVAGYPDLERVASGKRAREGLSFDRSAFFSELAATAGLGRNAVRAKLVNLGDGEIQLQGSVSYFESFDRLLIFTGAPGALATAEPDPTLLITVDGADSRHVRYDSVYVQGSPVRRVTTQGGETMAEVDDDLDAVIPALRGVFGPGASLRTRSVIPLGNGQHFRSSLPRGVHAIGTAATGTDKTISDVIEIVHDLGAEWT